MKIRDVVAHLLADGHVHHCHDVLAPCEAQLSLGRWRRSGKHSTTTSGSRPPVAPLKLHLMPLQLAPQPGHFLQLIRPGRPGRRLGATMPRGAFPVGVVLVTPLAQLCGERSARTAAALSAPLEATSPPAKPTGRSGLARGRPVWQDRQHAAEHRAPLVLLRELLKGRGTSRRLRPHFLGTLRQHQHAHCRVVELLQVVQDHSHRPPPPQAVGTHHHVALHVELPRLRRADLLHPFCKTLRVDRPTAAEAVHGVTPTPPLTVQARGLRDAVHAIASPSNPIVVTMPRAHTQEHGLPRRQANSTVASCLGVGLAVTGALLEVGLHRPVDGVPPGVQLGGILPHVSLGGPDH